MPTIELTDTELTEAAPCLPVLALQAQADPHRLLGPTTRKIFENSVRFHEELVRKFEGARGGGELSATTRPELGRKKG